MEHEYWKERLQGYLDNELSPADHEAVARHIEECAGCRNDLEYFRAMKKRIKAFGEHTTMPESVEQRIRERLEKKRRGVVVRLFRPAYGLAIAAALVMAIALPRMLESEAYAFTKCRLEGKVTCPDCSIAERAGLQKGELCRDGHTMGLLCPDGEVYRIAMDENGLSLFEKAGGYYGKEVVIAGTLLEHERMIRVEDMTELVVERARLVP